MQKISSILISRDETSTTVILKEFCEKIWVELRFKKQFIHFPEMCKSIIFVFVLLVVVEAAPPEYHHHPLHDESIPIVKKFEEGIHAVEDSFYSGNLIVIDWCCQVILKNINCNHSARKSWVRNGKCSVDWSSSWSRSLRWRFFKRYRHWHWFVGIPKSSVTFRDVTPWVTLVCNARAEKKVQNCFPAEFARLVGLHQKWNLPK